MSAELFVKAARKKYRFESKKGSLTVEDLFDLSLESLNQIAIAVDDKIQQSGRKSFINRTDPTVAEHNDKLEILKYVILTKQTEAEKRRQQTQRLAQRQQLEDLLEEKRLAALRGMPLEEIEKRIAALDAEDVSESVPA